MLRAMGIEAIYPKPHLSQPGDGHEIHPYLLAGLEVTGPDQVWCADITYVPMPCGFLYLVAVMDWWSRLVLAWRLLTNWCGRSRKSCKRERFWAHKPDKRFWNSCMGMWIGAANPN